MKFIWFIIVISFLLQFMDASSGMGFGTTISPLLLVHYSPLQVVPALLISQTLSGFTAAIFHGEFENVEFFTYPLSPATQLMLKIAGIGCIGTVFSIFLVYYSIKLPTNLIKLYVSLLLILMGILNLITIKNQVYGQKVLFSFAALAGFNKGVGGGGYGPVITLGQFLSGVYEKSAVGITTFAEGITSLIGTIAFGILGVTTGIAYDLVLLPSLFTGAFFASILSPYTVRVLPSKIWRIAIPIYSFVIGVYSLLTLGSFL